MLVLRRESRGGLTFEAETEFSEGRAPVSLHRHLPTLPRNAARCGGSVCSTLPGRSVECSKKG